MSGAPFGPGYLLGLFGVVVSGAVLPVVPTGAAVSVAASLAGRDDVLLIALVVMVGAAAAYVDDLATYAVLSLAGRRAEGSSGRVARWLQGKRTASVLNRLNGQLERHALRTLLLSRLVPGGQVPVLVASALGGYPWRRYAVVDIAATILWAAMYATIGLTGRAVFPEPWEGAAAGIALVVLISLAGTALRRRTSDEVGGGDEPGG